MDFVARISKEWRRRMLFLFLMISGIAGWFLYDGYIMWPNEQQRYVEYTEIKEGLIEAGDAVDEESSSVKLAWQRHAKEAGYVNKTPKERTDSSIREQLVIGWVMMSGSLLFGAWIAWNHTRCVKGEGEIVIGVSGERVELDSIVAFDLKKWKNKGIAYAIYEAEGKTRRLTLDDHKFKGCEVVMIEAKKRIKARAGSVDEEPTAES